MSGRGRRKIIRTGSTGQQERLCFRCGEFKLDDEKHFSPTPTGTLRCVCRACKKSENDARALAFPERAKASRLKWALANIEAIRNRKPGKRTPWERAKIGQRNHRAKFPHLHAQHEAKRKAQRLKATPSWAEPELINLIYAEAAARKLHVDHVVPLISPVVCGLHVHTNMALLTKSENSRKRNAFVPGYSGSLTLPVPRSVAESHKMPERFA